MPRRILQGRVESNKGDKTVQVRVERRIKHPLYKKFVKHSKRYSAHDAENRYNIGDFVRIQECAPHSKRKRWEIVPENETGK